MIGFSVFLNDDWSKEKENYIHQMADSGFEGVFTSLHIPEDDPSKYSDRLKNLLKLIKTRNLKLMIDISNDALKNIGLSLSNPKAIFESGITGLRMDDGIDLEVIANLSHWITVGLNASTLTEEDYEKLVEYNADFSNMEAWHNYYPRPNTGLDEKWFYEKNVWLKSKHFKLSAFAPGDDRLRFPLYETLPTLEIHRYQNPFYASLSLLRDFMIDDVYIGDPGLLNATRYQFKGYFHGRTILFHAITIDHKWDSYVYKDHRNRLDVSKDVIRSEQSRMLHKNDDITSENTVRRKRGSITIDNNLYKRYKGEIQIVKRELSPDAKVNVIGQILDYDLPLLDFVKDGTKFKLADIREVQDGLG
ncbi:MupG family TIM beta-alpha barrel fold protein [Virgibacillus sp. 179-BFC.A HS]|uniref:MupG family TIM beta-alpha barrel fold protein n=1 Tax=Tigheibacillus jepli TaxID=3035914 RepID=A0ABU5CFH1_9BACI|nr:MupG family TIM beta-alpha barrel fold protein [Virgibacillus sp. 179-BFC.A HS]MDY0405054.1 MupG family TIM beta-alpha barrel fold protein [Virgibacillus sp. 179-BFC.A HS]